MSEMDVTLVKQALRALGRAVDLPGTVEVLLVGKAAGMLTGLLGAVATTADCDVMACDPPDRLPHLEAAARAVAEELGLAEGWFNSDVQLRRDALPDDWQKRRVWVGDYGPLRVYAVSRPDLIAMKVLANRPQDREDLLVLKPRQDEMEWVAAYLDGLDRKGTSQGQIDEAKQLLKELKEKP